MDGPRFRLRSGADVVVRPLRRDDSHELAVAVENLSAQTRYRRFHSGIPRLSDRMVETLTDVDQHDHVALAAVPVPGDGTDSADGAGGTDGADGTDGTDGPDGTDEPEPAGPIVGVARFVRDPKDRQAAELSIAVADEWQRRGLGSLLLRRLAERAREEGVARFTAEILADNAPTIALIERLGKVDLSRDADAGDTVTARMETRTWPEGERSGDRLLRSLAEVNAVLVPQFIGALLDVSVDLTRTLVVPVASLLGGLSDLREQE